MFFHIGRLIENGSQRFVSGNILFFLSLTLLRIRIAQSIILNHPLILLLFQI